MNTAPDRANNAVCLLACSAAILLAGCDRSNLLFVRVDPTGPSPALTVALVPQTLRLHPVAGGRCPFLTPFTTDFDLLIDHHGGRDLFVDQVTIRLLDGSSVGGSPVLMSAGDLAARFGSTNVRSGIRGRFGFHPRFDCDVFVPRHLRADVVLRDGSGARQVTHLMAPVEQQR
jgi:hypothetical protein